MTSTVFFRVASLDDKPAQLKAAIGGLGPVEMQARFELDPAEFAAVHGSPFSYWVPRSQRSLFSKLPRFEQEWRTARVGLQTSDDFRFVRGWWECAAPSYSEKFVSFSRGGTASPFYFDADAALLWANDGRGLEAFAASVVRNRDFYFRPALTWPLRAARFAPAVLPRASVFSIRGYAMIARADYLLALAGLGNSRVFDSLFKVALGRVGYPEFVVGILQEMPVPNLTPADEAALAALARRAWSLKRSLDTRTETSHAFVLPALLQTEGRTLAARSAAWTERVQGVEAELVRIQAEIDERCFVLYGISDEDRRAITEGFGGSSAEAEAAEDVDADTDTEDEAEAEAAADTSTLAAELVSWAAGVAFGRFDVRLAAGERALPAEPEPFDPLPVCSPAMLTGADGLPLAAPPAGYPLTFPVDGTLVDDPGHPDDLTAAVQAVFDVVFGASADAIWQEASGLLDPKGHDLRTWLAKDFFAHHLARHSKSRRKAPILWQLGTPSGRYSTWCYAHRLTRDSLFALARDVVGPKLVLEERRQASLVTDAGVNPAAKQRAELETHGELVAELRAFADEVRRVAPLWNPDLDDGIVLVEAPLHRLVPHKPWAKELKGRWDDLVAGKYDWAHLAMHFWPERVVPKCATDRSLAIAHGLEDVFWIEGTDAKWMKRARPTRTIEDLVTERTSPAVKAALADLLAAPTPAAAGRGRGRAG